MKPPTSPLLFGFVRCASVLAPRHLRAEWLAEWKGELAYVLRTRARAPHGQWLAKHAPAGFCLGAFSDALWLAHNTPRPMRQARSLLKAPLHCLGILVVLAGMGWLASSINVDLHGTPASQAFGASETESGGSFLLDVAMALAILPATTSLSMGEYPHRNLAGRRVIRWRLQLFLLSKVLLVLVIAYFAGKGLAHCSAWTAGRERWGWLSTIADVLAHTLPLSTCLICVFGFRWLLRDQRQRCPACLHRLSSPARVGPPSRSFLSWNGTELICRGGHGLLHVPEMPTSWLATQRWQDLDASWQMLFPE